MPKDKGKEEARLPGDMSKEKSALGSPKSQRREVILPRDFFWRGYGGEDDILFRYFLGIFLGACCLLTETLVCINIFEES